VTARSAVAGQSLALQRAADRSYVRMLGVLNRTKVAKAR
jgi:hypothetical protein